MSLHHRSTEIDWDVVFTNLTESAKRGYAVAMYDLGKLYYTGTPLLPQDHARAVAVLKMASYQVKL